LIHLINVDPDGLSLKLVREMAVATDLIQSSRVWRREDGRHTHTHTNVHTHTHIVWRTLLESEN